LLCSALAVLYARADAFAAALILVIDATRALLTVLVELQIGVLCQPAACPSPKRHSSLKLVFWHASCPNSSCTRIFDEMEVI